MKSVKDTIATVQALQTELTAASTALIKDPEPENVQRVCYIATLPVAILTKALEFSPKASPTIYETVINSFSAFNRAITDIQILAREPGFSETGMKRIIRQLDRLISSMADNLDDETDQPLGLSSYQTLKVELQMNLVAMHRVFITTTAASHSAKITDVFHEMTSKIRL